MNHTRDQLVADIEALGPPEDAPDDVTFDQTNRMQLFLEMYGFDRMIRCLRRTHGHDRRFQPGLEEFFDHESKTGREINRATRRVLYPFEVEGLGNDVWSWLARGRVGHPPLTLEPTAREQTRAAVWEHEAAREQLSGAGRSDAGEDVHHARSRHLINDAMIGEPNTGQRYR